MVAEGVTCDEWQGYSRYLWSPVMGGGVRVDSLGLLSWGGGGGLQWETIA